MGCGWQVVVGVPAGVPVGTEAEVVPPCRVPPQAGHGPVWLGCWPSSAPAPVPAPSEAAPAPLCRENTRGVSAGPTVLGPSFTCPLAVTHPLTLSQSVLSDTPAQSETPQIPIHIQLGAGLTAGGTAVNKQNRLGPSLWGASALGGEGRDK